jgi:5'(3')-deoxyribonucleotidase
MILLDLDGVLVDFVGGALRVHGSQLCPDDINRYDMVGVMGVSGVDFWKPIDAAGPEFWRDLESYPWFDQLYHGLKALGRVVLVTQPSWSWHSFAGKKMWLDRVLGPSFRDYAFIKEKDLLARPTRVLVDDSPHNIASFLAAGGEACLFPQPWNGEPAPDATRIDELLARVESKL